MLFLTTNRVGDFDEAFTSRIHVSLYYPPLDSDKTIKVFQINIKMIEDRFKEKGRNIVIDDIESFAKAHFDVSVIDARWNGRQIRNACQTVLALAEFEAQGKSHEAVLNPDAVVHLKVSHFETVQHAYRDFAKYINDVHGSSAEIRAQEGKVRATSELMHGRLDRSAGFDGAESRRGAFAGAARSRSDMSLQPATPVSQPAVPYNQSLAPGQPSTQPMYMAGGQQYMTPSVPTQGYYPYQQGPFQQPMFHAQQSMGMPLMQQPQ